MTGGATVRLAATVTQADIVVEIFEAAGLISKEHDAIDISTAHSHTVSKNEKVTGKIAASIWQKKIRKKKKN